MPVPPSRRPRSPSHHPSMDGECCQSLRGTPASQRRRHLTCRGTTATSLGAAAAASARRAGREGFCSRASPTALVAVAAGRPHDRPRLSAGRQSQVAAERTDASAPYTARASGAPAPSSCSTCFPSRHSKGARLVWMSKACAAPTPRRHDDDTPACAYLPIHAVEVTALLPSLPPAPSRCVAAWSARSRKADEHERGGVHRASRGDYPGQHADVRTHMDLSCS